MWFVSHFHPLPESQTKFLLHLNYCQLCPIIKEFPEKMRTVTQLTSSFFIFATKFIAIVPFKFSLPNLNELYSKFMMSVSLQSNAWLPKLNLKFCEKSKFLNFVILVTELSHLGLNQICHFFLQVRNIGIAKAKQQIKKQ